MEHLTNKRIIEEYLKAFATLPITAEKLDRFISDDNMELRRHVEVFQAGAPGYVLAPHEIIAEGDKVVVRFTFHGRHTGELMGMPPTGNLLKTSGIIIYEMKDGKISNQWMEFDAPTLFKQLEQPKMLAEEQAGSAN
ncbi:MAG: hypothetical protein RLY31_1900 [Bacteroidota bacterium]|jgi:predicted ester cyclase